MSNGLPRDVQKALADIGIYEPDPDNDLHKHLVEAVYETRSMSEGNRLARLNWVFDWYLSMYGTEYAEAKADYDTTRAKFIVAFRDGGEKSGVMCEARADATDEVHAAHLRYRTAEQLVSLAKHYVRTIEAQQRLYQTAQANQRAADQFHARTAS